jgi:quercetin 2,3-dioxygenase
MFDIYRAEDRFTADHGWLKSNFSFSFAEYYDPNNMQFGPMKVLNDDVVKPLRGFGRHPHREMEIVSIVLKGQLKHEDSAGHSAVTTFGGVQRMSAGTGVIHSEVNPSSTEEVNFLQLWFMPEEQGLTPSYEKTEFEIEQLKNALLPVVSKQAGENVAFIHQDLTIYLSDLDAGKEVKFQQNDGRRVFFFVIEGEIVLNQETTIGKRDSVRITNTPQLMIKATDHSRFMLIDLP